MVAMSHHVDDTSFVDASGFLASLALLPGSYEGPTGIQPGPYGLLAYGEASFLSRTLGNWIDCAVVTSGTQFMLAAGFDFEHLASQALQIELAGAKVIRLGFDAYKPDLEVNPGVLSLYTYVSYLAHASGHAESLTAVERVLLSIRDQCQNSVDTASNPAKQLAWALWNRVPLLLTNKANAGLGEMVQRLLARVGKTLSIALGDHPLEVLCGAFEGRRDLADDVVALVIGREDQEVELAKEVLASRVAQTESLTTLPDVLALKDTAAQTLAYWYLTLWVAAYLALLQASDPANNALYDALREAASEPL
jgi:hypothetical protein